MLDLSQFENLSKNFPRNVNYNLLKSSNNTFIMKYGRAKKLSALFYVTPALYMFYQLTTRNFSRYYQKYPEKTEYTFHPDFNTESLIEDSRKTVNYLNYN
jgi:hypothetical protein